MIWECQLLFQNITLTISIATILAQSTITFSKPTTLPPLSGQPASTLNTLKSKQHQ